jgi:nitrogen fixation-related uncharacterized protein
MMIALIAYKLTQMFPKISERAAVFGLWIATFLLIGAAIVGLYLWAYDNGRDDERARWEAAAAKIEAADAKADAAGTVTAAETKGQFDATNKAAEDAARNSDDGLAAAFDELRRQAAGEGDKAAR